MIHNFINKHFKDDENLKQVLHTVFSNYDSTTPVGGLNGYISEAVKTIYKDDGDLNRSLENINRNYHQSNGVYAKNQIKAKVESKIYKLPEGKYIDELESIHHLSPAAAEKKKKEEKKDAEEEKKNAEEEKKDAETEEETKDADVGNSKYITDITQHLINIAKTSFADAIKSHFNYENEKEICKKYPRKIFGIKNPVNQCYSNALFQMFYSMPMTRKIFTEGSSVDENNEFIKLFIERFENIHNNKIIRQNISTCLNKDYPEYKNQQDVTEVFRWFVDNFENSNIDAIKNFTQYIKITETTNYLCSDGKYVKTGIQTTNNTIDLPIGNGLNDISSLLYHYLKYEELGKDEQIHSDKCTGAETTVKSKQIAIEIPDNNRYLIITLKRFKTERNNDGAPTTKIEEAITPNEKITIDNTEYTLTGVICHIGKNVGSGHYVYYECNKDGKVIYLYNDWNIDEVKNNKGWGKEINEQGYMFLYSRYPVDQYNQENTEIELKQEEDEEERKILEEEEKKDNILIETEKTATIEELKDMLKDITTSSTELNNNNVMPDITKETIRKSSSRMNDSLDYLRDRTIRIQKLIADKNRSGETKGELTPSKVDETKENKNKKSVNINTGKNETLLIPKIGSETYTRENEYL